MYEIGKTFSQMAKFAQVSASNADRGANLCGKGGDASKNDEGRPHPGRPSEDWCRPIDQKICLKKLSDESPCFLPLP
jgi:hypothetical protein